MQQNNCEVCFYFEITSPWQLKIEKNKELPLPRHQPPPPPLLIQTAAARETKEREARLTFAVGVVVPQRAEAVLARAAAPRLQVDTVGVLHAAVALGAEVMTCRRPQINPPAMRGGASVSFKPRSLTAGGGASRAVSKPDFLSYR